MNIGQQIAPFLEELQKNIGQKNTFYGNKVSPTIMKLFEVETRQDGAGLLVPYWIGVTQRGRGPRIHPKDHNLKGKMKAWMQKRGMLTAKTQRGRNNQVKSMVWYINHYGNKQFNLGNPKYIDIYDTERKITIKKIDNQFGLMIGKITTDIL